jgi:hypothetical protein
MQQPLFPSKARNEMFISTVRHSSHYHGIVAIRSLKLPWYVNDSFLRTTVFSTAILALCPRCFDRIVTLTVTTNICLLWTMAEGWALGIVFGSSESMIEAELLEGLFRVSWV